MSPLEPEWRGRIAIEISNTTPCPEDLRRRSIAQILFLKAEAVCKVSYADKRKYQDQVGLTLPFVSRRREESARRPVTLVFTRPSDINADSDRNDLSISGSFRLHKKHPPAKVMTAPFTMGYTSWHYADMISVWTRSKTYG
jgi:hypothetical protein